MSASSSKNAEDELVDEASMSEYVVGQLKHFFVQNIPSDSIRELPKRYMYILGALSYIVLLGCFLAFFVTGYITDQRQNFISLESGDEAVCSPVTKESNGNFYADVNGNWIGSTGFIYSEAKYLFEFNQYSGTEKEFYSMVKTLVAGKGMEGLGRKMKSQDLALNLVLFTSYMSVYKKNNESKTLQYFSLSADAPYVFNTMHHFSGIASVEGFCNVNIATNFNLGSSLMSQRFSYNEYMRDPICNRSVNLLNAGYFGGSDIFDFAFDVRSFITALAVNFGFLRVDELEELRDTILSGETVEHRGVVYDVDYMIDPAYPGMTPIACLTKLRSTSSSNQYYPNAVDQVCLLDLIDLVAVPTFNHFGNGLFASTSSYAELIKCICDGPGSVGLEYGCSEFNLIASFFVIPNVKAESDFPFSFEAYLSIFDDRTPVEVNALAYNASFASINTFGVNPITLDPVWRKNAFQFCSQTGYGDCSVISFHFYDPRKTVINEFSYQLSNASCRDTASVMTDASKKMAENPPFQLTENYVECRNKEITSLINSLGIASGNSSFLVPLALAMLLPLIYLFLKRRGVLLSKDEYEKDEREKAVLELGLLLLRARDGKTRGMKPGGLLIGLTKELIRSCQSAGGYPDSDDDDDSDDEEDEGSGGLSKIRMAKQLELRRKAIKNFVFAKNLSEKVTKKRVSKRKSKGEEKEVAMSPMSKGIGKSDSTIV